MRTTVAQPTTPRKAPFAHYCTLYNDEIHGVITQVDGVTAILTDDGAMLGSYARIAPWVTILGEVGVAECQKICDTIRGGAAQIACRRSN